MSRYMPGESFDAMRERCQAQDAIGKALGDEAHERGDRLTPDERHDLMLDARWGSDGYPVAKLGRLWQITRGNDPRVFKTKREAVIAWEIHMAKLRTMSGLESYAKAKEGAT